MVDNKAWDRLEEESKGAYARFLVYLYLGPGRTVSQAISRIMQSKRRATDSTCDTEKAKKGEKRRNGQWERDSIKYHWKDRASAYDIEMLAKAGSDVVVYWVSALSSLALVALREVDAGNFKPTSLAEFLEVINVLGNFVTPETVQAAREFASGNFGRTDQSSDE